MLSAKTYSLSIEGSTYYAWTIEDEDGFYAEINDFTNERDCVASVQRHLAMWQKDIVCSLNDLLVTFK